MTKLRNNEDLKHKLVGLVFGEGISMTAAAERVGVPDRSVRGFFAKTKKWQQEWWEENQANYDKYFNGFGRTKSKYVEEPKGEEVRTTNKRKDSNYDNSRILLISDMHIPYHHPDTLEFLAHLLDKYNPTRVICLGDELDKHALSFHDSDPNLPSAGDELKLSLPVIKQLKEMFPVMDILESNHGSLVYRKAHHHGIPKEYLKSYNDILGVDEGWQWHYDMVLDLPNGNKCYLHHGKASNVTKTSQTMSMCAVQGHFHETFKVEYWGNPVALYWAMQCGCLIDDNSYAFSYNNVNLKRPIVGTGLIIDSQPVLEPMILDRGGRWVGRKVKS